MDAARQAPLGGGQAVRLPPPPAAHGAAAFRQSAGQSRRLQLWSPLCTGLHALHHFRRVSFEDVSFGGVFVPSIYSHAGWQNDDVPVVEFMYL